MAKGGTTAKVKASPRCDLAERLHEIFPTTLVLVRFRPDLELTVYAPHILTPQPRTSISSPLDPKSRTFVGFIEEWSAYGAEDNPYVCMRTSGRTGVRFSCDHVEHYQVYREDKRWSKARKPCRR